MYHLHRTAFPTDQTVELPRYRFGAFTGQRVELIQQPWHIAVDLSVFDAQAIACATDIQPEGWEIRGLIALESVPFARALEQTVTDGHARRFGAVLEDEWYLLAPIHWPVRPRVGHFVVVGLYR